MSHFETGRIGAVAEDDLATCVNCGLCLPHCPTYRVTGDEARSPRGRIAIIKDVQENGGQYDRESAAMLNSCIQCRGCEPACPSGVPYGRIIGSARQALVDQGLATPKWGTSFALRTGLQLLARPRLLSIGGRVIAILQAAHLIPERWSLGPLPIRLGSRLQESVRNPDVWIFTGCVMDVWMRATHRHTAALVTATGHSWATPTSRGVCCGALHQHAGFSDRARSLAVQVMDSMPGEGLVLVNSAGCGAALKEYGELLGSAEAHHFASRVRDVHEWLEPLVPDLLARVKGAGTSGSMVLQNERIRVVLQDPCHLRHVQKSHGAVRAILEQLADVITIDDDGLCCGAGGAYSMMEPTLARQVRSRKIGAIGAATGGQDFPVVSANPGCAMFLAQAGLTVCHPLNIVAEVLGLSESKMGEKDV